MFAFTSRFVWGRISVGTVAKASPEKPPVMACFTMVYETVIRVDEENELKIYDDSTFAAASTDNVHDYVRIHHLGSTTDNDFMERIGLRLDCVDSTSTSCLLVAEGVGARTSDTSFVLIGRRIHVAIGYFLAAIELVDCTQVR